MEQLKHTLWAFTIGALIATIVIAFPHMVASPNEHMHQLFSELKNIDRSKDTIRFAIDASAYLFIFVTILLIVLNISILFSVKNNIIFKIFHFLLIAAFLYLLSQYSNSIWDKYVDQDHRLIIATFDQVIRPIIFPQHKNGIIYEYFFTIYIVFIFMIITSICYGCYRLLSSDFGDNDKNWSIIRGIAYAFAIGHTLLTAAVILAIPVEFAQKNHEKGTYDIFFYFILFNIIMYVSLILFPACCANHEKILDRIKEETKSINLIYNLIFASFPALITALTRTIQSWL